MSLARTTVVNGAATAVRLGAALALNKLLAVYVGPSGFGIIGQFQSITAMVGAAAGGIFGPGVTKLTAEHGALPQAQIAVWRTALTLGLVGAGAASLLVLVLGPALAEGVLGDAELRGVLPWLAASSALLAVNTVLLAALAGLKQVYAFVTVTILGSLASVGAAALLVLRFGLFGGLIALPIGQALCGVVTALVFRRVWRSRWRELVGRIDPRAARALAAFGLMAATTAVAVPVSQIVIRDGLTRIAGAELAGLWQAMWKLSEAHLLLLTTTLSLYFLPRLAEIRDGDELRREIAKGYRFVLPLVVATAGGIFLLREPLTVALFSPAFLPLAQALGWQMLGDVLKIGSWIPAYTMISHARTRLYVATELVFAGLVTLACLAGVRAWGLQGAAAGYAATYAIYWVVLHGQLGTLAKRLDGERPARGGGA
jgi:PST family polysaccharide transporter